MKRERGWATAGSLLRDAKKLVARQGVRGIEGGQEGGYVCGNVTGRRRWWQWGVFGDCRSLAHLKNKMEQMLGVSRAKCESVSRRAVKRLRLLK